MGLVVPETATISTSVSTVMSLGARYTAVVFGLLAATSSHGAATTAGPRPLVTPSTYTVPGAFPTSAFSKVIVVTNTSGACFEVYSQYYAPATATASQVQPVIHDPINVSSAEKGSQT
jgi:sphingomyelin phosphodiesterase